MCHLSEFLLMQAVLQSIYFTIITVQIIAFLALTCTLLRIFLSRCDIPQIQIPSFAFGLQKPSPSFWHGC